MVAGVKAERCRSCADGTPSDGLGLAVAVGHASQPSPSDWPPALDGHLGTPAGTIRNAARRLAQKRSASAGTHVVLKSAQLLLAADAAEDEDEEEAAAACPGAGGGVDMGCRAAVGGPADVARRLTGASLSGIRSAYSHGRGDEERKGGRDTNQYRSKLLTGAFWSKRLGGGAFWSKRLGGGAFWSKRLGGGAFWSKRLGGGAFWSKRLGGGAFWSNKLGGGAFWSNKLGGGAFWSNKLGGGAFWSNKLGGGAFWSNKLGGGAVWSNRLGGGAVWSNRLRGGAFSTGDQHRSTLFNTSPELFSCDFILSTGVFDAPVEAQGSGGWPKSWLSFSCVSFLPLPSSSSSSADAAPFRPPRSSSSSSSSSSSISISIIIPLLFLSSSSCATRFSQACGAETAGGLGALGAELAESSLQDRTSSADSLVRAG
ncbi:Protein RNA-directed DNA methylation 3 [Liparis tanakae]|uniref:Protein RNA-directed DNA methylation 3 n=1 Tax=Liparis tanakae TaxID=230148 RepID=A0A4Z2EZG0_9TELE|nr:Protein RNA-directed DNA methylation 3 [Liparis tanakae]